MACRTELSSMPGTGDHDRAPGLYRSRPGRRTGHPIRAVVAGTLRDQLGHEGLVMTDALTMGGVRDTASDEEIVVLALEAGVDLLLMA